MNDRLTLHWGLIDGLHVIARDRTNRMNLIGGLGIFGVGIMWQADLPFSSVLAGYDDAPELECPPEKLR